MKKYSLPILSLFVIAGCVIYGKIAERSSAQDLSKTAIQIEARVDGTVREAGVLQSADTLEIRNDTLGATRILSLVPDGSRVSKGDLLVELDGSAIEEKLQQQRIQMAVAVADLAQAKRELDLRKLEQTATVSEAEAALQMAILSSKQAEGGGGEVALQVRSLEKELALLEKKTELVNKQKTSNVESEHIALQYTLMLLDFKTQSEIATDKLEHLKTQVLPLQQQSLKKNVTAAENQLELKKLQTEANTEQASAQYETQQVSTKFERDRFAELQQQWENCRILAPRDGIVVYANMSARRAEPTTIKEGATVRERQVIMRMPDRNKLQVKVSVHESKIARVKEGQSAVIRFDALPDRDFKGSVVSVSNFPVPGTFPNADIKTYEVLVNLENPAPELKIGLTCLTEIDVSK